MSKSHIECDGTVVECLRGRFKIAVDIPNSTTEHFALCRLAGKMGKNQIRVVTGDKVKVELSEYDLTRGRITFRYK